MKLNHLLRQCSQCGGSGYVTMTGVFADTLALLKKQSGEVTAAQLALVARCKATAMSNRLAALERMGFVSSRRYGRLRLFHAGPS